VPVVAQVLKSCHCLTVAILYHFEHELSKANEREAVSGLVTVEVLQDDGLVVFDSLDVLDQTEFALDQERLELVEVERTLVESVKPIEDLFADHFHPGSQSIDALGIFGDELIKEGECFFLVHSFEHATSCSWHHDVRSWVQDCLTLQVLVHLEVFHFLQHCAVLFFLQNC